MITKLEKYCRDLYSRQNLFPQEKRVLLSLLLLLSLIFYYEYGYRQPKLNADYIAQMKELHNLLDSAEKNLQKELVGAEAEEKKSIEGILNDIHRFRKTNKQKPHDP